MSKIKADQQGRPYVVINGGVYRPQPGPHEYPIPQRNWGKGVTSVLPVGAEVFVKNMNQSPFCKVAAPGGVEEIWTVHGHDVRNADSCFHVPVAKPDVPKPVRAPVRAVKNAPVCPWDEVEPMSGEQVVERMSQRQ